MNTTSKHYNEQIIIKVMKKMILSSMILFSAMAAHAQVTVEEPEFINSYCVLTSDSTYDVLPKEEGTVGSRNSKAKSILGKIGNVASATSALGGLGAMVGLNTGSINGALAGLKAMNTASSIGNVASTVSTLAGMGGMDIVFNGATSSYGYKADCTDMRIIVRNDSNETDPSNLYRIVRFKAKKKERRVQWMSFDDAIKNGKKAKKRGYLTYEAHKYGESSYILTIPKEQLTRGEYGIFYMNLASAVALPVGTFSIK